MAHADLDLLFDHLTKLAQKLLQENGAFLPLGAVVETDGQVRYVAAMTDKEYPGAQPLLDILTAEFRSMAASGAIRASGISTAFRFRPRPPCASIAVVDDINIRQLIEGLYTTEPKVGRSFNEIARLILTHDDNPAIKQIEAIGRPVIPFLVNALADPRTRSHYRKARGHLDNLSPFGRICDLLEEFHPSGAAAPLAAYLDHPVRGVRKRAALCLGSIAAPDCIEPVTRALTNPDKEVRFYAMMGIERALKLSPGSDRSPSHADPAFLSDVFPAIARLLNEKDWAGHAPRILLRIDRERALPLLLAPKCLSPANENLELVLKASNAIHYQIPHRLLLPLLKKLESRSGASAAADAFAQALLAYGNHPDAAAETKLRSLLVSPDKAIAAAAAEALALVRGLDNIFQRILQIEKLDGFDALSEPQKRYYSVFLYDADVRNGGHIQYLANFAPREFRLAADGLRAIRAPERADVLEEALQVFGRATLPRSRSRRHQVLSGLTKPQRKVLSDLDQRYFEGKENVDKLLALYAAEHKREFSREPVRRRSS